MFSRLPLESIALAPLLPLLAAALIALWHLCRPLAGDEDERVTARVFKSASLGSLLVLLTIDVYAILYGTPGQILLGTWFAAGGTTVRISFTLDALSLPFATLVAVIGFLALSFSAKYLHREPGFHRFFMITGLFIAAMLLIVLAGNAVLAFVGWELAGAASYLLIGYAYQRNTATVNSVRAFITNRIGDAGFILAIALSLRFFGTTEWPQLGQAAAAAGAVATGLVAAGFILAAQVKSAQVPFTPWITRALEGPTPSSAIFYGSLMVHAGVYLCLRLEPVLLHTQVLMLLLATGGLLTLLYGWLGGLVQSDVKSALLFGTLTQVGIMFLTIGLGLFGIAAWHLGLHAAFRAWQFLAAPSYMHDVNGPSPAVPDWLARSQRLYTAALERFWLERLGDVLLTHPTRAMGYDMRNLDERVVARLVGAPDETEAANTGVAPFVRGRGVAGALLAWVAVKLHRFEQRLLLETGGGPARRALHALGEYFAAFESMLERPRYLLLIIMIIFIAAL